MPTHVRERVHKLLLARRLRLLRLRDKLALLGSRDLLNISKALDDVLEVIGELGLLHLARALPNGKGMRCAPWMADRRRERTFSDGLPPSILDMALRSFCTVVMSSLVALASSCLRVNARQRGGMLRAKEGKRGGAHALAQLQRVLLRAV